MNQAGKDIPLLPKSEILRRDVESPAERNNIRDEEQPSKHIPVTERPDKSFSIRDIISEAGEPAVKEGLPGPDTDKPASHTLTEEKSVLTPETFSRAWIDFVETLKGEGTRIISMFKAVKTEMEEGNNIKIHLNNAAQKDIFVENYKQKLRNYLEERFQVTKLDIETSVDLSDENAMPYSDEQKYNYLAKKYPVLKDFKKTFNLDIT